MYYIELYTDAIKLLKFSEKVIIHTQYLPITIQTWKFECIKIISSEDSMP